MSSAKVRAVEGAGQRPIQRAVRVVFGIGILGLLLGWVDLAALWGAVREISLKDIVVLALLSVLLILVSCIKWRAFLVRLGVRASLGRLCSLYLLGYFVNLVMPSVVGGDVVRSLYVSASGERIRAVSATLLERYTGVVAMLGMALVVVWWAPAVTWQIRALTVVVAVGAACASAIIFMRQGSRVLRQLRFRPRWLSTVERLEQSLITGLGDRALLAQALGWSLLFHMLTVANTAAAAYAVGWDTLPIQELFVVVPLILLVGAVPIAPSGLGIQEGAFVFFLHSIGATTSQALAIALLLRAKSLLLALCGWVVWLRQGRLVRG
jgi:uncharacterized protein (TIRG00374 family)